MKILYGCLAIVFCASSLHEVDAFAHIRSTGSRRLPNVHCAQQRENMFLMATTSTGSDAPIEKNENKAMAFLRKIGKVGGDTDFKNAIGVDEGTAGKAAGKWGQGKVGNRMRHMFL